VRVWPRAIVAITGFVVSVSVAAAALDRPNVPLDWQHGEASRLIYDCEPVQLLGGKACR